MSTHIELKQFEAEGSTAGKTKTAWRWQFQNGWTGCEHQHRSPEGADACYQAWVDRTTTRSSNKSVAS